MKTKNNDIVLEKSVLVLDAGDNMAQEYCACLAAYGMETTLQTTDGTGLLHVLEEHRPDIVLMTVDQVTEKLIQQLQLINEYCPLPIVLQQQCQEIECIQAGLAAGVSVFLSGEINIERLPSIVLTAEMRHTQQMQQRQQVATLEQQLSQRKVIEKAKGLLMQQKGLSEDEAYCHLRSSAMQKNQSIADLAHKIVEVHELIDSALL